MSITQEERESITRRYRAILSGMGLDVGLAEGCAESEIKGGNPMTALQRMREYQAMTAIGKEMATQEVKKDSEAEDLKEEIEAVMLHGKGTAAYHQEQPEQDTRNEDPKTARLRNEIESIMFGGRTA